MDGSRFDALYLADVIVFLFMGNLESIFFDCFIKVPDCSIRVHQYLVENA